MAELTATNIIERSKALQKKWSTRNSKMEEWWRLLTLVDELEQEGMESVTSNDPRTAFNLALHLLTSSTIAHRIPSEELEKAEVEGVSYLERYMERRWLKVENEYRKRGRQSWLREVASLMLSSGWYSVYAQADEEGLKAEVWHPSQVFPDFSDDGMPECSHIYTLSAAAANWKAKKKGWSLRTPFKGQTTAYDYWKIDDEGIVANAIVLGDTLVKPAIQHPELFRIPIFISPVSGLPDRGALAKGADWQKHEGEALIASAEGLMSNYNKLLSFQQQLMRDTANPRWFEQSRGDTPILRDEDLFKRGAIFRGTPEENVGPLAVPPIPIELRTTLFEYQNMIQRALFPWVMYGNIQQQIAGYAMSQVASAAMQVLTPYHQAIMALLSDIDNFWLQMMLESNIRPPGFKKPSNLPVDIEFDVAFDVEIPGLLIQRATVARMLDPNFRLSTGTVMDKMFPEVKDPLKEQARARKDDAMSHPVAVMVDQIMAYRREALALREAGDEDTAKLYEKAADTIEAQMGMEEQPAAGGRPTPGGQAIPREVQPREVREIIPPEGER